MFPANPRALCISLLLVVPTLSMPLVASAAGGVVIRLEAESYQPPVHDGGPNLLQRVDCSVASGGQGVEGLDPGDWIDLPLTLQAPFCFRDSLCSAAVQGLVRGYQIDFIDSNGITVASDTLTTVPGLGVG